MNGRESSSSRVKIKDFGLTYGVDEEMLPFLAVKISLRVHSKEGAKERRSEGAKERRSEGAKERRSEGAKERRSEGAKE